ncbi:hypothetical protein ACMX25_30410 [Caballeronia sp. 15715]|uniref:hypothetical protein n=1 Tax=Caballeronia sp. 15715 TaxID=3391030 RepID=UPI0039E4B122
MSTKERIIPAEIHDDGSVHYPSVMSASDDSVAVCAMVPDRIIPVIFVPGVMGTNLKSTKSSEPVWLVNSAGSVATDWAGRGAAKRKRLLDPKTTDVYTRGKLSAGNLHSEDELYRRGWGEVANMSYGTFLPWLDRTLNDANTCGDGWRAKLLNDIGKNSPELTPLTHAEVGRSQVEVQQLV